MITFNVQGYRSLLNTITENQYKFVSFDAVAAKSVLLRHDIDVSPKLALDMAKIEAKMGVKATYFFMFRSPFYNLFSRGNNRIVHEIISLGHDIGLHYDEGFYPRKTDLQTLIDMEASTINQNFGVNIKTVSFHQPSSDIIQDKIKIRQINTYCKDYFKTIKYLSDSNMIFKEEPEQLIASQQWSQIQLLIHPVWWMAEGRGTEDKFMSGVKVNFEVEQQQMLATEGAYGDKKRIKLETD